MPDAVRRAGPIWPTPLPAQRARVRCARRVSSVPFELLVSPGDIVAVVIVEQRPFIPLGKGDCLRGLPDIDAFGDRLPRFTLQRTEVALQIAGCRGPVYAGRPMAGYRSPGAYIFEPGELRQPALETAVEGGDSLNEQQIRQQQCPCLPVEHTQIAVRVRIPVRCDLQNAPAQIDLAPVFDQHRRSDDRPRSTRSQDLIQMTTVILTSLSERVREAGVSHELRLVLRKRSCPEDMIW